jgi:hypothetical protein
MNRVLRALLLWVMVIAMPLQGLAASTMLFCEISHGRMTQDTTAEPPAMNPGSVPSIAHHHTDGHHGAHVAPEGTGDDDWASHADRDTNPSPAQDSRNCSACAACCVGLALPARFVQSQACCLAEPMPAAAVTPLSTRLPDGLDRPPRSTSA